jgi:hypothetical protein
MIGLPTGEIITAFVDKADVMTMEEPMKGVKVDGFVLVSPVEIREEYSLVDLPQASLAGGTRIEVPTNMLARVGT